MLDPEATSGALFVVSLPIGNDADVSPRAIEVLERVDLVLAEDTRRLHALEQRVGLRAARATSYHDHNEAERVDGVLEQLRQGARVALVSDAGTPLFSDPGYVVVSRAVAEGIAVSPVPGPSAALAVLAACGFPIDRFVFGGFLPRRSAQRRQAVTELTGLGAAVVCYESAARLAATLADVLVVAINDDACARSLKGPDRPIVPQDERAELIAGFRCVTAVTILWLASLVALVPVATAGMVRSAGPLVAFVSLVALIVLVALVVARLGLTRGTTEGPVFARSFGVALKCLFRNGREN